MDEVFRSMVNKFQNVGGGSPVKFFYKKLSNFIANSEIYNEINFHLINVIFVQYFALQLEEISILF
jgi:hypothetical protein